MSPLYARATAIIPLAATLTLADKEGYFYKLDAGNKAVAIAAVTDTPHGLIGAVTDATGLEISAIVLGGNHGTVRVKLGADVTDLRKALQLRADGTVGPDAGTGARTLVAMPLELGTADELIEAVLLPKAKVIAANAGVSFLCFPVTLVGVTAADIVTGVVPGFAFEYVSSTWVQGVPVTTGGKLATITPWITGVAVTGGVLALTSATCTPLGHKIAGSAVTATNLGGAADTLSFTASAVTGFAEGTGIILAEIRNLDSVNAG